MENMTNAECNDCPIATNQQQAATKPEVQNQTTSTISHQVRTRTVEAIKDTVDSTVAIGKIVTIGTAAGVVAVSNGVASSARAVAKQCDDWSAGLRSWILSK